MTDPALSFVSAIIGGFVGVFVAWVLMAVTVYWMTRKKQL